MRPESKELELEPAEPTPQAVVHQIFSNCIPETHVCALIASEGCPQQMLSSAFRTWQLAGAKLTQLVKSQES